MAKAMVTTVRPNANETPSRPIPTWGTAAARTALPHPPSTNQKVPINSAASFLVSGMNDSCLYDFLIFFVCDDLECIAGPTVKVAESLAEVKLKSEMPVHTLQTAPIYARGAVAEKSAYGMIRVPQLMERRCFQSWFATRITYASIRSRYCAPNPIRRLPHCRLLPS